jgi:signal transduction histidine kinase
VSFFLWVLDEKGLIIAQNKEVANRLGYDLDQYTGRNFLSQQIIPDELKQDLLHSIPDAGIVFEGETHVRGNNGTELAVYLIAEKIVFPEATYRLISALELTRFPLSMDLLKESDQGIKELQSCRDNIFSVIAHDLRSPFNTILGYCELLSGSIINQEADKSLLYTKTIRTAAEQTLSFLIKLLEWGRMQNEHTPYHPKYFQAAIPIREVISLCTIQSDTKKIALITTIEPGLNVFGDPDMIRTVLLNLVSNAIKFSPSGGIVHVQSRAVPQGIEFAVIDNGIGIYKDNLTKIFDFEKPYTTNGTGMEEGTGLGLSICKCYIDLHKGSIWAESDPGKGSSFKFVIPSVNLT